MWKRKLNIRKKNWWVKYSNLLSEWSRCTLTHIDQEPTGMNLTIRTINQKNKGKNEREKSMPWMWMDGWLVGGLEQSASKGSEVIFIWIAGLKWMFKYVYSLSVQINMNCDWFGPSTVSTTDDGLLAIDYILHRRMCIYIQTKQVIFRNYQLWIAKRFSLDHQKPILFLVWLHIAKSQWTLMSTHVRNMTKQKLFFRFNWIKVLYNLSNFQWFTRLWIFFYFNTNVQVFII